MTANGYRISFEDDVSVLTLIVVMAQFCEYTRKTTD